MRSRRLRTAAAPALPAVTAADTQADPVLLTPAQQEKLLAARAWWQEGDRALDYLAEQGGRGVLFSQLRPVLEAFRADPSAQTVRPVLLLVRQLTGNRALHSTLFNDGFAQNLHTLLYGSGPLFSRLTGFLQTVHVGPQTASHLLFAAFPDRYPLVSKQTKAVVGPLPAQTVQARAHAAVRFGDRTEGSDNEAAATPPGRERVQARVLLGDFAVYEAVCDFLQADTFDTVHGILWHAREMSPPPAAPAAKSRRKASAAALMVREPSAPADRRYAVQTDAPAAENPDATENDLLAAIEREIAEQGFTFAPLVVRRYYVALKAKPFVILTGLSGTGKTRLTHLFARAVCGESSAESDQYLLVPVRPDWMSGDALLGYHNLLTGQYIGTPFLHRLQKATLPENRDRAFFVCLDEMNLARVEYYFSDLLSAMETASGRIPLYENQSVVLPPNVFLTGSVNVDEATHPFSRKVLDRANTIEFGSVQFGEATVIPPPALADAPAISSVERQKLFLHNRVLSVAAARARMAGFDADLPARATLVLSELNDLLAPRQMHFGYRVRDEVLRYVAASFETGGTGLFDSNDPARNETLALDAQILQKVLPRLAGTHETLINLLRDVQTWATERRFFETANKLAVMQARGDETGLVSFYEP